MRNIFIILLAFSFVSCNSQNKNAEQVKSTSKKDTMDFKIVKTDSNGNFIFYGQGNTGKEGLYISKTSKERLTLDFNIHFHMGEVKRDFDQLIIAELKQESLDRNSPFYKLMKKERIRPYRLSKYCIGSVEIYGEEVLKFNRFKKKLLFLNKINHAN